MANTTANIVANVTAAAADDIQGVVSLLIGISVTFGAAAVLAFSMTVQRYALTHKERLVPMWFLGSLSRGWAWSVGLAIYVLACLLKVVGFNFAPVTILASVFTTLLIFNLIFARWLLGEQLTRPKLIGALLIITGAVTCTAATPFDQAEAGLSRRRLREGVKTVFAPEDIVELLRAPPPGGAFWLGLLVGLVALSVAFIAVCERKYPLQLHRVAPEEVAAEPAGPLGRPATPPRWLHYTMMVVYPASLGLDESIADLCIKAYSSMIGKCTTDKVSCDHWVLYLTVVLGVSAGLASAVWMRVVFARYETTVALPIEYGSLNAWLFLGGLTFYQEGRAMSWAQLSLAWVGTGIILLGIALPYLWVAQQAINASLPLAAAHLERGLASTKQGFASLPHAASGAAAQSRAHIERGLSQSRALTRQFTREIVASPARLSGRSSRASSASRVSERASSSSPAPPATQAPRGPLGTDGTAAEKTEDSEAREERDSKATTELGSSCDTDASRPTAEGDDDAAVRAAVAAAIAR